MSKVDAAWEKLEALLKHVDSTGTYSAKFAKLHRAFRKSGLRQQLLMAIESVQHLIREPSVFKLACALIPVIRRASVAGAAVLGVSVVRHLVRGNGRRMLFEACILAILMYFISLNFYVPLCDKDALLDLLPVWTQKLMRPTSPKEDCAEGDTKCFHRLMKRLDEMQGREMRAILRKTLKDHNLDIVKQNVDRSIK